MPFRHRSVRSAFWGTMALLVSFAFLLVFHTDGQRLDVVALGGLLVCCLALLLLSSQSGPPGAGPPRSSDDPAQGGADGDGPKLFTPFRRTCG